ncbi:MAG: gamma-glutamyl-gamma-aminobutyrate hydrolase family protein [Solirubrobacterales bacterium]|nr:gamma-glutamyl-gamma-aminobutyrate hydrolase family protein [Solirubrobacterales bacterium]
MIIGIPTYAERVRHGPWDEPCALLPLAYVDAVQRAGATALLVPPTRDPDPVLERIDGLILSGGVDVDPALYGATPGPGTDPPSPARDASELALTRAALSRGMPVLAICRGAQLLNVALGGTLCQHLPDGEHRRVPGEFNPHTAELTAGSLAARTAGGEHVRVLSHHHQAISELGAGLVVSGRASDGTIEAVEDPSREFLLGVQWHPEVDPNSPVIARFVSVIAGG